MAKVNMKAVRIVALRQDRKRLLEHLQDSALMQVKKTEKSREGFDRVDMSRQLQVFERDVALTEQALKILNGVSPEKSGLLSSFKGRREIDPDELGVIAAGSGEVIGVCKRLAELDKKRADNNAERARIATQLAQLEAWEALDIPLNTTGTRSTAVFVGSLPEQYDLGTLSAAIAAENPKLTFELEIVHDEPGMTCAVVFVPMSQKAMADETLRVLGFARPMGATSKIPKDKARRLREKSERLRLENEMAEDEIASYADRRGEIKTTQDYFRIRADKYKVINGLDHSRSVFVIEGWVPEEDCERLRALCERAATCTVDFSDAGDDAPVKLKNNRFAEPAESILTMYSPPGGTDIDPTPLLAFFFYFFFGMMFSDAGYGVLMVVATSLILKIFKPDKSMRNTLRLFRNCGVFTTLWGLVFGSIFGDLPAVIYQMATGTPITMKELLPWPTIDPQKDSLLLMVISIAFGLVHILVGMGCKFYSCCKRKDWGGAFFDTGLWMLLLVGLAVLAAGIVLGQPFTTIGAVIAVACAVGLVLTQGRGKKGIVGKAIGGVASLYDITSYVSDLLSYSRLLALGLTTGVMAQVFNMLGSMLGGSVVGFIFMIVIMILGHLINIGLNALGSYVHTMRLQYVEMFSKFYEGGGTEFKPFSLQSKYIKIQEEQK